MRKLANKDKLIAYNYLVALRSTVIDGIHPRVITERSYSFASRVNSGSG
jgi:hypothetical protein